MGKQEKMIGIVGGMGPAATVDLMQRIIKATPANDDQDHLHIIVDNNPKVPSRIKALIEKTGESPAAMLNKMALSLEKQGADILVMPCNTAHFYYEEITQNLSICFLNMLDLSMKHIHHKFPHITKVGLLASTAVQITQLYESYAQKYGIEIVYPKVSDQAFIMDFIKKVKSNKYTKEDVKSYHKIADNLYQKGTECLLIACTELSVIGMKESTIIPYFDALDILVENIINESIKK